ncbi:MAG TPA: response regulator transcription factor [Candidatus Saccharimonadales bacterium]|nr:response regulator transcription factor [Candidatus Saccharimonadales bacterium]
MSRILLVDDDPELLQVLSLRLQQDGYDVATANTGDQAIAEASRRPPDLMVLDLGMPRGNGFKVLERVRASVRTAATPVIVLTGNLEPAFEIRARKAGADEFLHKPTELADLVATIQKLLAKAPSS